MFASIFGKKKTSPDTPPEESDPIPSHDAPVSANGDDFIFVDRKNPPAPMPATNLYPSNILGGYQPPNVGPHQDAAVPVPYVQGVPFKLSPELSISDTFETTQFKVDGILAMMTRQLEFDDDYDFALERGLVEQ